MPPAPGLRPGIPVFALLLLAGCARAPQGPVPDRLQRLLPALGPAEFLMLDGETRPATRMAPGESRTCRALVGAGSQLLFAVGITDGAPAEGAIRLRVLADGRELIAETLPVSRRRWLARSVRFEAPGDVVLEFRADSEAASGGAAWIALASARVQPPRSHRRPRVLVWVSQDTLRADHLGAYGYQRDTSPNFDRLGRGFTLFERAVSPASWTLPSLTSQMTSRYPSFHGATHRSKAADTRYPTLFETLAQDGFTVLGVTGNPFVSAKYTLARGFDALVYTGRRADVVSRLARQLVDQSGGGDLALFVHYMDPHDPYNPPEPYQARFGRPYAGEVNGYNHRSAARTEADIQHVRDLYDGEIAFADHEIAALLEALEQKGILERAVIAYTADHGEELKDHGGWGHAHTLHEELLHVPFALRIPGVAARRIAMPVSLVDLSPTLLDALGIEAPASYQGRSLLPLARGGTLAQIPLFSETSRFESRHKLAVREGRFKYTAEFNAAEGAARERRREDLFDLEADPGEQAGLTGAPESEPLRKQVEAFLARARAAGAHSKPALLDPGEDEELRALGYVN